MYIRRSKHTPPNVDAVRDLMPAFFEFLQKESQPAVRVVLGHFFFVYIHPYVEGNRRIFADHYSPGAPQGLHGSAGERACGRGYLAIREFRCWADGLRRALLTEAGSLSGTEARVSQIASAREQHQPERLLGSSGLATYARVHEIDLPAVMV